MEMSSWAVQAQKEKDGLDVHGDGAGVVGRLAAECAVHAAFDGLALRCRLAHFADSTVRVVLQVESSPISLLSFRKHYIKLYPFCQYYESLCDSYTIVTRQNSSKN